MYSTPGAGAVITAGASAMHSTPEQVLRSLQELVRCTPPVMS